MNNNLKKWLLSLLLSIPIIIFYCAHFFYHDAEHRPSGLIQSEHALYMIAAKEYQTGNAALLYQYPLDDDSLSPKIFFQLPIFILGYVWKWSALDPGFILSIFGMLFTLFTMRVVVSLLYTVLPEKKYLTLISVLFCWGGGLLALIGVALYFFKFNNMVSSLDHIFFLDPGQGWWCLNFGRSLIYPLEAFYHFLFVLSILMVLKKAFATAVLLIVLLTISHPYSSTEILVIIFAWASMEFFYVRSSWLRKKDYIFITAALFFQIIYYGVWLRHFAVSRIISQQVALDWSYKIWHFLPAYSIVWLLSFLAVKNIPLLKKQFISPVNRLFFCWGLFAFLLSVHGFAIKPIQPLHYTRGYVYAGFFLFALPGICSVIEKLKDKKSIFMKFVSAICIFIFLSDNIMWFYLNSSYNKTGVLFTKGKQELLDFFTKKSEQGWVIGPDHSEELTSYIQLYSPYKGWIPHPILTFNIESKKNAYKNLMLQQKVDDRWKTYPVYLYLEKHNVALYQHKILFPISFENDAYIVYKIN